MTDLDALDVVESRPRRQLGRRGRRRLVVLTVLVALAAGALWWADRQRRAHEFDQLLGCATTAEAARSAAETRIDAMAGYVRPSLTVYAAADRGLYRIIADEAAVAVPDFDAAVRGCERVRVLSIHSSLGHARTAYLAYLRAEDRHLSAVVADGSHAFDDVDEVLAARAAGYAALTAAAPNGTTRRRAGALARVDR
jgi:hypothetical protein